MKNLLTVIFALSMVVLVKCLTDEQKTEVAVMFKACAAESKVDQYLIAKARKGEYVDDAKLKDHFFCMSKKLGFQNEAGEVQLDVLKSKVGAELKDEALTQKVIEKCVVKKNSPQKTAFDAFKCVYESTPTHINLA